MKKILFLDFDGVLHPDGLGLFSNLPLFEKYLVEMPEVEVVITSTWREDHNLDELRNYFSVAVREKFTGVTPILEDGYDSGGRQREIHAYLDAADLNTGNASWIALDDMSPFFEADYPHLILTDSTQGFSESNGKSLLEWYKSSAICG